MWDIFMLKSESEEWIFLLMIFLYNMLRLVVGHLFQPTTLTISTHIDHVHIAQIIIIVLVIVHPGDNPKKFHMSKWTQISPARDLNQIPIFTTWTRATILISCDKLKPWEIVLPNFMNCAIWNICNSITFHPSSYNYLAFSSQSTLEDALKVFMQNTGQAISDLKNATMENTRAIARIEWQFKYLVAEVTRIEEKEFQSQLMATRHYMINDDDFSNSYHEHVQTTTILEREHLEQIEPSPISKVSNDKEVSTEAPSFIIVHLETPHEPQASVLQCLKEPSYDKFVKDPCTQGHKSMNHLPKKMLRSKQRGYLRWLHILPEGYQSLKKKGWKGLVGHPNDLGRCRILSFPFYFPHIWFLSFFMLFLVILFLFLTAINLLMFVLVRKYCC
jgi:hypothetical protein